jgi:translocation and assembly module TamB
MKIAAQAQLDGLVPDQFSGNLDLRKLTVRAGAATVIAVDVEADYRGKRNGDMWRMWMDVEDAQIKLPRQAGRGKLHPVGPLEDVVFAEDRPLTTQTARVAQQAPPGERKFRLDVKTPRGVHVRGEEVDVVLRSNITVSTVGEQVALVGPVEVLRGHLLLFGRRYEVLTAQASFDGEVPPNPTLNVRLAHQFDTATLYIEAKGTLEEPEVSFASDPPVYDQAQLLGFVLGGRPGSAPAAESSMEDKAAGVASAFVSGKVAQMLKNTFPVDVLRVGTDPEGGQRLSFVTVGKWLTEDLFVAYRRRFEAQEDENTNEANAEYQLLRDWILEGVVGDRGAASLDVLWVKRY